EIGMEGPKMRDPGQKEQTPFYVQYPSARHIESDVNSGDSQGPYSASLSRDPAFVPNAAGFAPVRPQGSAFRQANIPSRGPRARGESILAMSKRVDFSIGMKDISSGDIMGDVYDDVIKIRLPDLTDRGVPRSRSIRDPNAEREGDRDTTTLGHTSSRDGESRSHPSLHRSSTETQTRLRSHSSVIHKNRFFRRGKDKDNKNGETEDLMEQGMANIPESGHSEARSETPTPDIIRQADTKSIGSLSSWQPNRSLTEDFEMKRLR
ncbi:MAG: hypothetical protein Q9187_008098, partial [Circinaria calcarea]